MEYGDQMLIWCEGGPSVGRAVQFPPPLEIAVDGGMYVLVDDGDIDSLVEFEPSSSLLDLVLEEALAELLGVAVDVVSAEALLERDAEIRNSAIASTHDRFLGGTGCRTLGDLEGSRSIDRRRGGIDGVGDVEAR